MANGREIICMAKVFLSGQTAKNMKVNINTIKNMDLESIPGKTVVNTLANGITVNNVELVSIEQSMELKRKEDGKMEKELNGLKMMMIKL